MALNSPLRTGANPNQIVGEGSKGVIADDETIRIINMGDNEYDLYIRSRGWFDNVDKPMLKIVRTYKPYELVDLAIAILEGVPDDEYIISKRVTVEEDE